MEVTTGCTTNDLNSEILELFPMVRFYIVSAKKSKTIEF